MSTRPVGSVIPGSLDEPALAAILPGMLAAEGMGGGGGMDLRDLRVAAFFPGEVVALRVDDVVALRVDVGPRSVLAFALGVAPG